MKNNRMSPEKELELINRYSTAKLTPEQVFCFTVTLCDNEIDRDHERFTVETLKKLSELFVGKTGISDHSMRSGDQRSRIFHTWLETDNTKKTSAGEAYTALKARAYMLRTSETASMISEIEGGIKKEVSISCSVNKTLCSICGEDFKSHSCKHIKGRKYNSQVCHAILSDPTDAYEWSFVAVPAQRNAGVTKSFFKKEEKTLTAPADIIKSLDKNNNLSDSEIQCIKNYVAELEKLAEDSRVYKKHLTEEIERLALIVLPKVNFKTFLAESENMSCEKLRELKKGLEAQAQDILPCSPQLRTAKNKERTPNHTSFKI